MPFHHPVVLVYLLAVAAYVAFGVFVLAAALLLALRLGSRRAARRLAGGITGSFPFLFFFQGLSLPALMAIAAVAFFLGIWDGPTYGPNVIAGFAALGMMLAVFVAASITGVIVGWRVGARAASGMPVRDALRASPALKLLASSLARLPVLSEDVSPERGIVIGLGIIVLTAGGLAFAHMAYVEAYGSDEMDYRGEKIRLAKKYVDYDDYKNAPRNLASSEIPRIEKMMTEAPIGSNFASWSDFVRQASAIKFPGYGMGPGPKVVAAGREFIVEFIEIPQVSTGGYFPQVSKGRYFILEKMVDGTLRLVDDFVIQHPASSAFWAISSVRLVDNRLVYSDRQSKIVRETPIAP